MKKLIALALVGTFTVPVLHSAEKPVINRKTQQVIMTVEDLAHNLTEEDREALYHNIEIKFRGGKSLGLLRYKDDPKLASKIHQIIMTKYENLQAKRQPLRPFKEQILDILHPETMPAQTVRKKVRTGPGPVKTRPAKGLRKSKVHMGPGPVITQPSKTLTPAKSEMHTVSPINTLHGPQSGSTRAAVGHSGVQ